MKNNKGFAMTETLVVTVFLVTIFTFLYVSIVPLIGKYEDVIVREKDIDIVYKLYALRKLIYSEPNKQSITGETHTVITCSNFTDQAYCNKLIEYLELDKYVLLYVNDVFDNLNYIKNSIPMPFEGAEEQESYRKELYNYMFKHETIQGRYVVLFDCDRHTFAHLLYDDEFGGFEFETPEFYAFGSVTSSSPTIPPAGRKIYLGMYDDGSLSVCIKRNSSQHCIKRGRWEVEKGHVIELFESRNCSVTTSVVTCTAYDYQCRVYANGTVNCLDRINNATCEANIDGTMYCSS